MTAPVVIAPSVGAGWLVRMAARVRGLFSRRVLLRLAGVPTVVLQGHVYAVRAVPLGVARDMVPALLRCSRHFAKWDISEALYDDLVKVLALGLHAPVRSIEQLTIPLWDLAPVVEVIARANGMPVVEAGTPLGELSALTKSIGTDSSPASSAPPAGPGSTSPSA